MPSLSQDSAVRQAPSKLSRSVIRDFFFRLTFAAGNNFDGFSRGASFRERFFGAGGDGRADGDINEPEKDACEISRQGVPLRIPSRLVGDVGNSVASLDKQLSGELLRMIACSCEEKGLAAFLWAWEDGVNGSLTELALSLP